MKKVLSIIFILSLFWTVAYGQENDSTKFGHITKSEIALKQNPRYHDAKAVVLFNIGKARFVSDKDWNVSIVFNEIKRIKIFTQAGVALSQIQISGWNGYGPDVKISHLRAASYNYENGKLVKTELDTAKIYKTKVIGLGYVLKFAIPNVRKGSIIEYQYQETFDAASDLPDWQFQSTIPVLYSHYQVRMTPFYQYVWSLQVGRDFCETNSYVDPSHVHSFIGQKFHDDIHYFTMRNIPAFKDEDYISSLNDYVKKVNFQLMLVNDPDGTSDSIITTWSDVVKGALKSEYFGKFVKKSVWYATHILKMNKLKHEPEKIRFDSIMNYAKSHFVWDGLTGILATESPDKFLKDTTDNIGEINLFTIAMLRSAGIDAYPVILSTRSNGIIKDNYPYLHYFNDVIILANVDGKPVLADASCENCMNNRLPERCINNKGLVIKKDQVKWVPLNKTHPSTTVIANNITVDQDSLKADVKLMANEYDALEYRDQFEDVDKHVKFMKSFSAQNSTYIDSSFSIQNQHQRTKPFKLKFSFHSQASTFNNKIYIAPFFDEIGNDNMFDQAHRTHPVDLVYPDKMEYITTLTIPSGYKVDFMPKPVIINNKLCELRYSLGQSGNKVTVVLQYYFKKAVYNPDDYYQLKYVYGLVVKKAHERIVLSKKTVAMK